MLQIVWALYFRSDVLDADCLADLFDSSVTGQTVAFILFLDVYFCFTKGCVEIMKDWNRQKLFLHYFEQNFSQILMKVLSFLRYKNIILSVKICNWLHNQILNIKHIFFIHIKRHEAHQTFSVEAWPKVIRI